jgi:AcrR family transcriptional regulator
MPINLDDPRTRKTRKALQEAFIRLILRKGYDDITIQDIASEADTARITFYRHYHDKEELLTDCLNTLYEGLVKKTERLSREGLASGDTPANALYEHIVEHEQMYRILFSSRGTQAVIERMRHHLATTAQQQLQRTLEAQKLPAPPIPLELIAHHAASAQIGLAIWWLEHGKPYPRRYMAQIAIWLSLRGIISAIDFPAIDLPVPAPHL